MPHVRCSQCDEQLPTAAHSCRRCARPTGTDRRSDASPSHALAWGSRLLLLLGLAFTIYGMEYGGGLLFSVAFGIIGLALLASFWRARVGVVAAGGLLALLALVQVVT